MAIGDGANDVQMIKGAHIGIGIHGVEGFQAMNASDYSIPEFRFLNRLIFYYGRESFRKNSNLIIYVIYKNLMIVLPQIWFFIFTYFS